MQIESLRGSKHRVVVSCVNTYLAEGVSVIVNEFNAHTPIESSVVIFDAENYYNIIPTLRKKTTCIMFCQNQQYLFLPCNYPIHRLEYGTHPQSLIRILSTIASNIIEIPDSPNYTKFKPKELAVIEYYRQDKPLLKMSELMGVHPKTIYSIRRKLFNFFSCATSREFSELCKSRVFSEWYSREYTNYLTHWSSR